MAENVPLSRDQRLHQGYFSRAYAVDGRFCFFTINVILTERALVSRRKIQLPIFYIVPIKNNSLARNTKLIQMHNRGNIILHYLCILPIYKTISRYNSGTTS